MKYRVNVLKIYLIYFLFMCACVSFISTCVQMPEEVRECQIPWNWNCKPGTCRELKLGPPKEQCTLLTMQPSLSSPQLLKYWTVSLFLMFIWKRYCEILISLNAHKSTQTHPLGENGDCLYFYLLIACKFSLPSIIARLFSRTLGWLLSQQ